MKKKYYNKKSNNIFIILFSAVLLVFLWIISMNIIIKKNETKKNSYLQSEMNSFTSKMSSILGSYEYFSNSVVDRKDPAFLKIINDSYKSSPSEKKILEQKAIDLVSKNFYNFEELGLMQFNVYFPNGELFLSFPNNFKNKKIPRLPNTEKKFLKDFGETSFYGGYKYVNMLVYEDKFIGTMEIFIPLNSVLSIFKRYYPTVNISYLVNEEYKFSDLKQYLGYNYSETNKKLFGYSFINITENNEKIFDGKQLSFFEKIEKDFLKTYNKESGFSLINNFNDKNFIIVFLPIKLSDKDNLGYLIATYENTQYDKIFKAQYLEIILVNIIILGLLVFIFIFMKDRNKFRTLSTTDYLTGAYNRTKFMEYANYELERSKRYKSTFSILLMDLDLFKKLNDTYGHNFGDEVLKNIAYFIKNEIRETDLLARWGGEEFICLLPNTDVSDAYIVAEKIRNKIEQVTFAYDVKVTLSIGLCERDESDYTIELVNEKADLALYRAKREGRNKVVKY